MAHELSNLKCEKAASGAKPYSLPDGGGLYLWVTPAGGKTWRWAYRFAGKMKLMTFGKYPDIPLACARVLHAQARALLASGVDPMAERKQAKLEELAAQDKKEATDRFTFEKLARLWFAWWKRGMNQRYTANVEIRIENDVIARIGAKMPAEITPVDLIELTKATDARGARDIAKRNLQFIRQIYRWGKSQNLLDQNLPNPAADIDPKMILSKSTPVKFAHLEIGEVPELLEHMNNYNGNTLTRLAMELLAQTFVRTGEMIRAEWKEIDWKASRWNLPAEHMKMKLSHIVPLSRQTMLLLKRLYAISGASGRLFPDYNGGLGTMSNNTILKALERMGYKGRMTGHGWRHIASTWLRNQGYNKHWVEAQLAHRESGVAGVYNEAEYLPDRAKMMQAWADFLDECRSRRDNQKQAA